MYRAILFDLDDTLYDLRSYRSERLRRALRPIVTHYPHLDVEASPRCQQLRTLDAGAHHQQDPGGRRCA